LHLYNLPLTIFKKETAREMPSGFLWAVASVHDLLSPDSLSRTAGRAHASFIKISILGYPMTFCAPMSLFVQQERGVV
jgi:hypothetical protein